MKKPGGKKKIFMRVELYAKKEELKQIPIEIYCTFHPFQLHSPPVPGGAAKWAGTWRDMGDRFANHSPVFGKAKIHGKSSGTSGKLGDSRSSLAVALWLISTVTILARSPPLRHTYSS